MEKSRRKREKTNQNENFVFLRTYFDFINTPRWNCKNGENESAEDFIVLFPNLKYL